MKIWVIFKLEKNVMNEKSLMILLMIDSLQCIIYVQITCINLFILNEIKEKNAEAINKNYFIEK